MREAFLYDIREKGNIRCTLCPHRCIISPGKRGICGVRKNIDGKLYSLNYNRVAAVNNDPIEKKPLYHFMPGSLSFSIAAQGCNFKCGFCQNCSLSQVQNEDDISGIDYPPDKIVSEALSTGCRSIAYTYTEPTVYFELVKDTAEIAQRSGLKNVMVSNGYISPDAINLISPLLDGANIDIKSFSDSFYRKYTGGSLEPVLETVRSLKEKGIWIEITTLLIKDYNTDEANIRKLAEFIIDTDPEIPWHMSRFFPAYKFNGTNPTDPELIKKYLSMAEDMGVKYVYGGNFVSGHWESTRCPGCGCTLIERQGYNIEIKNFSNGKCSNCHSEISGVWD